MIKIICIYAFHLLLTSEENQPIAVVSCTPNEDITDKIALALIDNDILEKVEIIGNHEINFDDLDIEVTCTDEDGEVFNKKINLQKIHVYN